MSVADDLHKEIDLLVEDIVIYESIIEGLVNAGTHVLKIMCEGCKKPACDSMDYCKALKELDMAIVKAEEEL